ncbi:ArnT family glycosyltransferase [Haloparvum sp. PAK95]|uniref:ArnT family glycosyltransferase n=1 Tax=Haloparvum sp. PAK95 TaxID=3418962 RepID=UPI003D2ED5E6
MSQHTDTVSDTLIGYFDRPRVATLALATLAAVVAVLVATRVFPHHSLNHDEGVYLQQAAMLLAGELFLNPPVDGPFRPWFFVESERGLYSKYAPLPAATFALGKLLGGYVVALAGVAASLVALTVGLGRELFDARTGLLAGAFLLASPLFLVQAGVYLPYAVTTALNLTFALAYLRAERLGSTRMAAVAGAAVALAFFARPYTALLFAIPFILHAVWTLVAARAWRVLTARWSAAASTGADAATRNLVARRVLTAGLGTLGVLVTLGYNAVVTGDPLLFPYQAFAPEDGIGFGHRQILAHEATYTLDLALRSNRQVVRRLFTDWVVAGTLGTALAAVGVGALIRDRLSLATRFGGTPGAPRSTLSHRTLLAGLFLTVPLGNVAFWGNFNVLGNLEVETDGLIHYLGPYYHYDLLVPTALFAAAGAVLLAGRIHTASHRAFKPDRARRVALAVVLVGGLVVGGAAATTAADPLERNAGVSDELEKGYAPFVAEEPPSDAVVFLPPVYGRWLNHPFQELRNDPDFDGERVYALGDTADLDVAAAYPDRDLYRYVHTGTWVPVDDSSVEAELRPVDRAAGASVSLDATLGIPDHARSASLRITTDAGSSTVGLSELPSNLALTATADGDAVTVAGDGLDEPESVALEARDEVVIEMFVQTGTSSGFTYRLAFPVASEGGEVRALSPTEEWCRVPTECEPIGLAGTDDGVSIETELAAANEST